MTVGWLSEPEQCRQHCLMLWSIVAIGSLPTCDFPECATPPYVHPTSVSIFGLPGFPGALVLQKTNTAVRRPGYEVVSEPDPQKNRKEGLGDRLGWKCGSVPSGIHGICNLLVRTHFISGTSSHLLAQ